MVTDPSTSSVAACVITAISHLDTGPITISLAQGLNDCNARLEYLVEARENLIVNRFAMTLLVFSFYATGTISQAQRFSLRST